MESSPLYEYFSRVGRLLMAEERSGRDALPPVQMAALHYLSHCNRYSDTPAAIADYLAATKGTVSQTLQTLERKGLLKKRPDANDRRVVRLSLTHAGRQLVRSEIPPGVFRMAETNLGSDRAEALTELLASFLRELQRAGRQTSFGVCRTCRHFNREAGAKFRCGLTGEPLSQADSTKICREHALSA